MSNNSNDVLQRDTSSIVMACLFIFMAVVFLWDTTNMLDSDSSVFPRAVAIAMIVLSILLIIWVNPFRRLRLRGVWRWWRRCWRAVWPCLGSDF